MLIMKIASEYLSGAKPNKKFVEKTIGKTVQNNSLQNNVSTKQFCQIK